MYGVGLPVQLFVRIPRPEYTKLLKKIRPDDTLVIKSIDRLGRNYEEIIEQYS
ncbi:MAG: recombinase family protein [Oscillospiraceae bacterium]|nr:recombinase family protein [Oscillospiraceae bacterium]